MNTHFFRPSLKRYFLYWMAALFLAMSSISADPTLSFQGQLTSPQGAPMTGSHPAVFSLYSEATGGTPLWSESYTGSNNIPFINGYFSISLGSITPIPQRVYETYPLYMGISVNGSSELLPRVVFQSVPFAIRSTIADNATHLDGHAANEFVLVGGIIDTLDIDNLTVTTANVQNTLFANSARITNGVAAGDFWGAGSRLTNLDASHISSGVLHLLYGGTGATTSVQARLNLGIDLNNLSVGNLTATGTIQAQSIEVMRNGRFTPLGALAFKNTISSADIQNTEEFRSDLGFNLYLPKTGGLMTGTLTLNSAPLIIQGNSGSVITLNANGDIYANQISAETTLTAREVLTRHNGTYQPLGRMAFVNTISSNNFTNLTQFKTDLGLGRLAYLDQLTSANLAVDDLSKALDLKALAHKTILQSEDINIEGLSTALRLGVLSHIDTVEAQHVNTANLASALGLGRLAYRNILTSEDINTRNIAQALNLGNLAFLDRVRGEDIVTASVSTALNLGALSHLDIAQPRHINIEALTASLNLRALSHLNTVEPQHLNLEELATALQLGELAYLNSITSANFENLDNFKSNALGLRALAYKSTISGEDFENITTFKRETLGLGRLATQNTISIADIADVTAFKQDLGLRSLAYLNQITTANIADYPRFIGELKDSLSLGALADLNQINSSHFQDFDAFKEDLGLPRFLKKDGDTVSGDVIVENGRVMFLNENRRAVITLSTTAGISATTLNVQSLSANTFTGESLSATNGIFTTTIQTPNPFDTLLLTNGDANFRLLGDSSIAFTSNSGNEFRINGGEIYGTTTGGETGRKYFKLSSAGQYFGSESKANGAMDLGLISTEGLDPYVFLGYENQAELLLDARDEDNPIGRFGFPGTGDRLTIGARSILLGNDENAYLQITAEGRILLKNRNGHMGLAPDGTLDLSDGARNSLVGSFLSKSGGTITGDLNINNGNLIIKNDQNAVVVNLSKTGTGTINNLVVNTLSADSIVKTGVGTLGRLAFTEAITQDSFENFNAFIQENFNLRDFLRRSGDTLTGPLNLENTNFNIINGDGVMTSQLTTEGTLWVKALKVGGTPKTATDIFQHLQLQTLEVASLNIQTDMSVARIDIGNMFKITSVGEMNLDRSILIGQTPLPVLGADTGVRKIKITNAAFKSASLEATPTRSGLIFKNELEGQKAEMFLSGLLFTIKSPRFIIESGDTNFRQNAFGSQLVSNEILLRAGRNEILLNSGEYRVSANNITYQGNLRVSGTITANAFVGNGAAVTSLNASNVATGILPIERGGTGVSSLEEARVAFALDARNMAVDTLTATRSITTPVLFGTIRSGSLRYLEINAITSFNRQAIFVSTANFGSQATFEAPVTVLSTLTMSSTANFRNDVIIKSRGNANEPSLHVINSVNKHASSYAMANTSAAVVGGTAFVAESFGRAPTIVAYHYSPAGYAFTAVKGNPADGDFNRANLYVMGESEGSGAVQVINHYDGHAIVAMNKSNTNKSTIHAVNEGHGQALTATTRGTLPAIAAYSMGDTAILAMGDIKMSSSKRWKKEIKPLESPLEKLLKLRGVSYIRTDKNTQKRNIGFIAEEVGEIYPELVDYEENGVDAKSVAYGNITAILVEALKEEHQKVSQLDAKIKALSEENAALNDTYEQFKKELAELKTQASQKH